jgi:UDPglucose--hexose-1-phosphate uridylyltransferase
MLCENHNFFAIAPFASIFPGETWIVPRRHVRTIFELSDNELWDLARIMLLSVKVLRKIFPGVSYNLVLHQAPKGKDFHLHFEIYPRLSEFSGFELGNEMYVNHIFPEAYANEFRKVNA